MLEILLVLAILALVALLVMPYLSADEPSMLRSAAEALEADLELAQNQSLGRNDDCRVVVFDAGGNRYWLASAADPATPLTHPVDQAPYVSRFGEGRLAFVRGVTLESVDCGPENAIEFGSIGELKNTSPARITLRCGSRRITVQVDPATGDVSIGQIH